MSAVRRGPMLVEIDDLPEYEHGDLRLENHYWVAWRFGRWLRSKTHIRASYEVQGVARALFDIAQGEFPTGTLPDDDSDLVRLLGGIDMVRWRELRALEYGPLRGWFRVRCGDEVRLAHPVVIEMLNETINWAAEREQAVNAKAVAMRLKRLRDGLRQLGIEERVLGDQVLIERMDQWLQENCKGRRGVPAYERALTEARKHGWFGRPAGFRS